MICDDIFVTSSGEMKLKKAVHTVRRNGRKDFLLLYVCDGICEFVLNGVKSTAKKGDVILYYPGEAQDYLFKAEPLNHNIWVHFGGKGCYELLDMLAIGDKRIFKPTHTARIEHTFIGICESFLNKDAESSVICSGLLISLLGMLSEYTKEGRFGSFGKYRRIINDEVMSFRFNPSREFKVAESAANCGMSITHFSRIFKGVTGEPPLKYITGLKIEKAKEMLIFTDESIGNIAAAVGYPEQNYFTRLFKRFTGMTPGKFRNN